MSKEMAETAYELAAAFGYITEAEVRALYYAADLCPPNPTIVNLGAGAGTSTLAFFEARSDATVYSVDQRLEEHPLGSLGSEVIALKNAGIYEEITGRYFQIHGLTQTAWEIYEGPPIDLLYVDDGHKEPEVRGDLVGWLPLVKPGAIVVLDDYVNPGGRSQKNRGKVWPDVAKVANELLEAYEMILHADTTAIWRAPNGA